MTNVHPLDILLGYRLGSRQATVELQRQDVPGIHIDFDVLRLVEDVKQKPGQAIILTGTAGDGKTYLAYRIIDVLGIDRDAVAQAQPQGGYHKNGVLVDLDLSAGLLDERRVRRLHKALESPERLTLVCVNEGKLAEFDSQLEKLGLRMPAGALRINLSRRALVSPEAWSKILKGILSGPIWDDRDLDATSPLAWNRAWLSDAEVAERVRQYLLLPYLLGEPITIRETLSFLAYALGGGRSAGESSFELAKDRLPYLLFNTVFSAPEGLTHGGRAVPNEKLLWWPFRFDPADRASPAVDLRLLVDLDRLEAAPPLELLETWRTDLVVHTRESDDAPYRQRLDRFMDAARRWYALGSDEGFKAFFPFRYFEDYEEALSLSSSNLSGGVSTIIQGLNILLSGGQVTDELDLKLFYLISDSSRQNVAIYSTNAVVDMDDLRLCADLSPGADVGDAGDTYLERMPRRLVLQYIPRPEIQLPVSILLYEVLRSVTSPGGGFPATLWAKERNGVARFMEALNGAVRPSGSATEFTIVLDKGDPLRMKHRRDPRRLQVT